MAQINSYPIEVPTTTDLIPFSDVSEGNATKSATVQSIANLANAVQLGYTSLVQLLNQTGTDAPVATELYNNTGETYTWSYIGQGVYRVTSTGTPFTVNKTVVFSNAGSDGSTLVPPIAWSRVGDNIIEVVSSGVNGRFINGSFEIKIYN
tara:strand:- start:589 stop:1038 length:450 start_codon:yes stop_codon:yes gene_type:complete